MKKINRMILVVLVLALLLPSFGNMLPGRDLKNTYESYLKINYYLNLNDFDQAEELIDKYLAKHPKDPFVLTEKAFLLQNVGNEPFKAMEILENVRAIYPSYYYSNYLLASLLYTQFSGEKTKVDRAIQLLELSIKDNNHYFASFYLLGIIQNDRKQYKVSNQYFEKANRLEQKLATYYYMSSNYHALNDRAGEIVTYEKILSLDPSNYKALRTLSQMFMEQENYKKAAFYLEKLFTNNPGTRKIAVEYLYSLFAAGESEKFLKISKLMDVGDSSLLVYARALLLSRSQKLDDALKLLDTIKNKDFKTSLLLSDIYLRKQDYYKAIRILEKVDLQKREHYYYTLILQTYLSLNLNHRIISLYNGVISKSPVLEKLNLNDYYAIFYAYSNLNRLDKLVEITQFAQSKLKVPSKLLDDLVRRLQNFSPQEEMAFNQDSIKYSPNLFLLLTFYKNRQNYTPAITLLERMIKEQKEKSPAPYLELYDIYLRLEKYDVVEKGLQQLWIQFPNSTSVQNFYAYFLALRDKQLDQALKLSAKTLSKDQDNPAYIDTYGYILFKMGRIAEAETILEKAFDKHPFEQEIMEHLVECYRIRRKYPDIIKIYQLAIQYNVDFKDQLQNKIEKLKRLR
jgi:tetratricopeptide (TPR) repeat protein